MVSSVRAVKNQLALIGLLVPSVRILLRQRRFGDAARTLQMLSLHSRLDDRAREELPKLIKRLHKMEYKETGSRVLSRYVPSLNQIRKDLATTDFDFRHRVGKAGTPLARKRDPITAPSKRPRAERLRRLPRVFRASQNGTTRRVAPKPITPRKTVSRKTATRPIKPRTAAKPVPKPTPKPVPVRVPKQPIAPEVYRRISDYEGLPRNRPPGRVYKNTHGLDTLGRGHLVVPGTVRILKQLFGNTYPAEDVVQGKHDMTMAEVNRLFKYDVNKRADEVRAVFPLYDLWPVYLQQEIMQAKYRGDLGPRTISLIQSGKWKQASQEIKRVQDYKHRGIQPRVDAVSRALERYGNNPVLRDLPPPKPNTSPTKKEVKNEKKSPVRTPSQPQNRGAYVKRKRAELEQGVRLQAKRMRDEVVPRVRARVSNQVEKAVAFAKENPVDTKSRLKETAKAAKSLASALVRDGGAQVRRKRMELDPQLRRLQARIQRQVKHVDREMRTQAKRVREETIPRMETIQKRAGIEAQKMKQRSNRGRNAAVRALKNFQGKVAKRVAEGPRRAIQRPRRRST